MHYTNSKYINSYHIPSVQWEHPTLPLQAYTTRQLSQLYKVSDKVFNNWIEPFKTEIGTRRGHYYTVIQVYIIFCLIGVP